MGLPQIAKASPASAGSTPIPSKQLKILSDTAFKRSCVAHRDRIAGLRRAFRAQSKARDLPPSRLALESCSSTSSAHLSNIPFEATANDVVAFINSKIKLIPEAGPAPPVTQCRLGKANKHSGGEHGGWGIITFSDPRYFDSFLARQEPSSPNPLVMDNRVLRIKAYRFSPQSSEAQHENLMVPVAELLVGLPGSSPMSIETRWRTGNRVSLGLDTREGHGITIYYAAVIKLTVPSNTVLESHTFVDSTGSRVLRFRLSSPPFCYYRPASASNESSVSDRSQPDTVDMHLPQTFATQANQPEDNTWERCPDPRGAESIFGYHLTYCLILPARRQHTDLELLHFLQMRLALRLIDLGDCPESLSSSEVQPLPSDPHEWCAGAQWIFRSLEHSRVVGSMIHALMATHKLFFRSYPEAYAIRKLLMQCTEVQATEALKKMFWMPFMNDPVQRLTSLLNDALSLIRPEAAGAKTVEVNEDLAFVQRVLVTPLRICPRPPDLDTSNRITRHYSAHRHRFLRVVFVDEDFGPINQTDSEIIYDKRIRHLVCNGIQVGGYTYQFLAYSNSQLREQGCWFYDETPVGNDVPPTCDMIRQSIGDLSHIKTVGKHASRLAQGFSSSTSTAGVEPARRVCIPDVLRNGYCFSDGVGLISQDKAEEIAHILRLETTPSAFQIRYGGAKGMVTVWPAEVMGEYDIKLRPSMVKFEANYETIEVVNVSKPIPCYLNRQLIVLLSALGIPDGPLIKLFNDMIVGIKNAFESDVDAYNLVLNHAPNLTMARHMLAAGMSVKMDPFLRGMIHAVCQRLFLDLELKARIFVPMGLCLIGVMDETETLPEGCIFFQYTNDIGDVIQLRPGTSVAVGRSPSLHPGDIRTLRTIDCEPLRHLVNVVVFSSRGQRPQANKMSGGDLDGDIFFIIWDPSLVPRPDKNIPPMNYTSSEPPQVARVTAKDIKNFFVDYIRNDNLGRIANAHVAVADQNPVGALCQDCIELAELHSTAVDFGKTGVPAIVRKSLLPQKYPDFMSKPASKSYVSNRFLGRAYRRVKEIQSETLARHPDPDPDPDHEADHDHDQSQSQSQSPGHSANPARSNASKCDTRFLYPGYEAYVDEARETLILYGQDLWEIMCEYEVWNEAELFTGFVYRLSSQVSKNRQKATGDVLARLVRQVKILKNMYHDVFWKGLGLSPDQVLEPQDEVRVLAKASAWYYCAYTYVDLEGVGPFLSFCWVVYEPMGRVIIESNLQQAAVAPSAG
ncbi:RNA dependent RNA polymerase-domain-containing protein [Polychytrium aggregatum]|uniref:RNA dependent RNA polymerase-domain-containing protein n=1 Tax=Polychytrium aggregatum TaxID=110093 RepID=UPI0022FF2555|nr:RNA dependent RNA polymerase-domain-containing protein [Polychytrium aggregatum]KAI9207883.1 RNA dependent RNA polymerase-domain-containing protein [Polychytrium aggregatum]